ncbi:MAG: type II toxin-antitoxin system prevent-host-death family antitoxin, partial [Nitrospirales bacterium]
AKTHFSQLIQRALAGEEIIVAKGKEPVAKIVPIPEAKKKRTPGGAKGIVKYIASDFDDSFEEFPDALG